MIVAWETRGDGLPLRCFYYTAQWSKDIRVLTPERTLKSLTPDLSLAGRVAGLVDDFVLGRPPAALIRAVGYGMDPPFKRMWPPRHAVVEMRTEGTRSFGFFAGPDVFVAHRLIAKKDLADQPKLYATIGDEVLTKFIAHVAPTDVDRVSDVTYLITGA